LIDNSQTVLDAVMEELGTGIDQIEDVYPCTHMQNGASIAVCKGLWSLTSTDAMSENVENLKTSDTDGQGSGY
jgi:hypothetical protein